ncbi:MAG: hypothetical protein ABIJ43_02715 [Candidatus Beckwithbacteria bacterium]
MHPESFRPPQQPVIESLDFNDNNPYRRIIKQVRWISPEELPTVFHTSSQELNIISPAFCQSFDYTLSGQVIPVTYILPWPHVNRVKDTSEVWSTNKQEGLEISGLPYTYLRIPKKDRNCGQIRVGSSMLDQYLLAAKNTGMIFEVHLTEISESGLHSKMKEYISLSSLPVIDAHQFHEPSPIGLSTGGIETHLPEDIYQPNLTGYKSLLEYLKLLPSSGHKTTLIDIANNLSSLHTSQLLHGVFKHLVTQNHQAILNTFANRQRLILNLREA